MNKHWKYFKYVVKHKYFVYKAGRLLDVPLYRLILHDWIKFLPCEWGPYVDYFYGEVKSQELKQAFDYAWLHHQRRSDHHWQAWVLNKDDGGTKALFMKPVAAREMVADWCGAGRAITGKWDVKSWYENNKEKIKFHTETRAYVEDLIDEFKVDI